MIVASKLNALACACLVVSACGGVPKKTTGQLAKGTFSKVGVHEVVSVDVQIAVGKRVVTGTVTRPKEPGKYLAVVLHAGSGPTDRNWNSPAMPGDNGSGKLLAEELTRHGAVVLRYDKQGTGGTTLPKEITWDGFIGDFEAGVDFLRKAEIVDANRVFVAGHSEGALHAIRLAREAGDRIAGLILLSPPGRSLHELLLAQLEEQFRSLAKLDGEALEAEMAPIREALTTFFAGGDVEPTKVSEHVPVQQLIAAIVNPKGAQLARALYAYDPVEAIAEVKIPILIVAGEKDIQVSPETDASRLEEAATLGSGDVTLHVAPNADHVLKHEEMPREVMLEPANFSQLPFRYNAADRVLDEDAVDAIVAWLAAHGAAK